MSFSDLGALEKEEESIMPKCNGLFFLWLNLPAALSSSAGLNKTFDVMTFEASHLRAFLVVITKAVVSKEAPESKVVSGLPNQKHTKM